MSRKKHISHKKRDFEQNNGRKDNSRSNTNLNYNQIKHWAKQTWHFIWHSNSILSWIVNIILAYVIIRFLFYPGLGLLFSTSFPMVAVISGSMEHKIINHDSDRTPHLCGNRFAETQHRVDFDTYWENCGDWYEQHNITQEQFSSFSFPRGFNKGDIILIYGEDTKNLKIGDVIVFMSSVRHEPIIHRIVGIEERNGELVFMTKGDHNQNIGPMDTNISEDAIIGKGVFRIPYLGWIKIWFTNTVQLIAR